MAIFSRKNSSENWTVSYKGMVVGKTYRDISIMSDVWERSIFAIVYDIVQDKVREVYVGSEWSDNKVEVDASVELQNLYHANLIRERRHREAVSLAHEHNRRWYDCHHMNVTLSQWKRLKRLGSDYFEILYTLLGTKKFRNEFRSKMADQVRAWLDDENPKYRTPLSPRQLACVDTRHYGRRYW